MKFAVVLSVGLAAAIAGTPHQVHSQEAVSERFGECQRWGDGATSIDGDQIHDAFKCLFAKINQLEEELRPFKVARGAVVAFDRHRSRQRVCPNGWEEFTPAGGRFVVGAGEHSNGLKTYPSYVENNVTSVGGAERVTLTEAQMPSHRHAVSTSNHGLPPDKQHDGLAGAQSNYGVDQNFDTDSIPQPNGYGRLDHILGNSGGSQPHNNMPPYIALYYCKKD